MNDIINSIFELCGGLFIATSIHRLYRDKKVHGVSLWHPAFFNAWGFWNLYFYPSVGCWLSFYGGLGIVFANTIWTCQLLYYSRRKLSTGN